MRLLLITIISILLSSPSLADKALTGEGLDTRKHESKFQIKLQKIEQSDDATIVHILHTTDNEGIKLALENPKKNTYLIDDLGVEYSFQKAEYINTYVRRTRSPKKKDLSRFHSGIGKKYILSFDPISKDAKEVNLIVYYIGGTSRGCCGLEFEAIIRKIPVGTSE